MIKKEIVDYIKKNKNEWIKLRHYFHQYPEIAMNEFNTSNKIKELLLKWQYEVIECGKTGVIGILRNGDSNKKIAIRAEFDGLPIIEENDDLPYKSLNENMHACGRDGHTTMALAACQYLAETKNFNGTFYAIFQPGEEECVGALHMINDGLFDKIKPDRIYALHNIPLKQVNCGNPGDFHFYDGTDAMMASNDMLDVTIIGKGAHGSSPQNGRDPIVAGACLVNNLQTIISRNVSPFEKVVITIGAFNAGSAPNIIPGKANLKLSVRNLKKETRSFVLDRINQVISQTCNLYNCEAQISIIGACSLTINDPQVNEFAKNVVRNVFGENKLKPSPQLLAGEDFGYFLEKVPGCMVFINNGDSADLHNHKFNFNDEILPYGVAYFIAIVENELI